MPRHHRQELASRQVPEEGPPPQVLYDVRSSLLSLSSPGEQWLVISAGR